MFQASFKSAAINHISKKTHMSHLALALQYVPAGPRCSLDRSPKSRPSLSEFICLSILALTFSQLFPRAARFSRVDGRDDWRHYRAAPTSLQPKQSTHTPLSEWQLHAKIRAHTHTRPFVRTHTHKHAQVGDVKLDAKQRGCLISIIIICRGTLNSCCEQDTSRTVQKKLKIFCTRNEI